ncbi:hypothetical protein VNO80_15598 [Phaseolus coccineus]|uniref:Uncharacterized protein n=1 Tax=Phaseolus coccineus TaxID=3886 RepID=A0AAN9R336_PHACN
MRNVSALSSLCIIMNVVFEIKNWNMCSILDKVSAMDCGCPKFVKHCGPRWYLFELIPIIPLQNVFVVIPSKLRA